MTNKQMLLATAPFGIFVVLIAIISILDLIDVQITSILMFTCLGCQQFFVGLRFYKEDKKLRTEHILFDILFGISCFIFIFLLLLCSSNI